MKYVGAIVLIIAVFAAWRIYCSFLGAQLDSVRSFLSALSDYREKVRCYLCAPAEWASAYADKDTAVSELTAQLADGKGFLEAYESVKDRFYLTQKADDALRTCLSRLGTGYLETELEVLASGIDSLDREERHLCEEVERRRRAVGALLGAIAMGMVILII